MVRPPPEDEQLAGYHGSWHAGTYLKNGALHYTMKRSAASDANPKLQLPSRHHTMANGERRVGVELEFTGLSIERIGETLRAVVGGEICPLSAYEHELTGSCFGDFGIELDYAYLKSRGRRHPGTGLLEDLEQASDDLLGAVAKQVVPFEVVCPPIAISQLHRLHPAITALRAAGACGTNQAAIYAFGLHLNPELPDLETTTLLGFIQAFTVALDWLRRVSDIDISRRVFPYIQPYTKHYARMVCDPAYHPTQSQLIDDYLAENASRNRALDMLPLFAWLDESRVARVISDKRVHARPTLHYRLPNCEIGQPDWDLRPAWNHWLVVEALAADPPRLAQICAEYCQALDQPFGDWRWAEDFERYL